MKHQCIKRKYYSVLVLYQSTSLLVTDLTLSMEARVDDRDIDRTKS